MKTLELISEMLINSLKFGYYSADLVDHTRQGDA